jgi:hypothetical protein
MSYKLVKAVWPDCRSGMRQRRPVDSRDVTKVRRRWRRREVGRKERRPVEGRARKAQYPLRRYEEVERWWCSDENAVAGGQKVKRRQA